MKRRTEPTPEHQLDLTRRGIYDNGGISHSSKKRVLTNGRIGFHDEDRDELWIAYQGALTLKGEQLWCVQINDDDDLYFNLEVESEEAACAIYLDAPMVIDRQWIHDMGFQ